MRLSLRVEFVDCDMTRRQGKDLETLWSFAILSRVAIIQNGYKL